MADDNLLLFEPTEEPGRARVSIDPARKPPHRVTPLLYSKFCEHLGYNIYQGMEAQILYNPTFCRMKAGEGRIERLAKRFTWPDAARVAGSVETGAAVGWMHVGPADDVRLSPDAGPHGAQAQRVETPGATASDPKGIGTWTSLPLHRTRGYEFRLVARAAASCRAVLGLAPVDDAGRPGKPVARAELGLESDWSTVTGRLELADDAPDDPDSLFLCSLTTESPANIVVDRVLLYPDDHVNHCDPDVIRMLKDARLPLLRYPGGNFVSAFDWWDGVGPVDERPTYPNPVWSGIIESNLFGTDEFMTLCAEIGCRPMICVNAGSGRPEEAAAWVEYCNGTPDTPMGELRARNGHPEPYGVRYWEVGNELFGTWQTGWTTPAGYVDRYRRFADAMRAVDPSIRLLACGGLHFGTEHGWNRALLDGLGDAAPLHTHHILEGGEVDEGTDPRDLFHAYMAYPLKLGQEYRAMRRLMLDAGITEPRLAITELQIFASCPGQTHDPCPYSSPIPSSSSISEALYFSLIAHECIRLGDFIEMITHSATVNHGGGLRKLRERIWANPVHYAHVMGAELAGGTPLGVTLACGAFSAPGGFGHLPAVEGAPVIDAMAVLSADEATLMLMLVHRSAGAGPVRVSVDLGGFAAGPNATVQTLAGDAPNDVNTRDEPERIAPRESPVALNDGTFELSLPPYSLTRIDVPRAEC